MRYIFIIVVIVHALIHLLGFFKAFDIFNIDYLTESISPTKGLLWLLAAFALIGVGFLCLFNVEIWWAMAFVAITLSQFLVITTWADTRFATILNVIILIIATTAYAQWNFGRIVKVKVETLLVQDEKKKNTINESQTDKSLDILENWLQIVGAKSTKGNVFLKQSAKMKLKPDARWQQTEAKQWFTTRSPGFVWHAKVENGSLMSFSGRDTFINGKGQMLIKIYGLIPIVNAKNRAIDEGTALRFLAEMVWFPWAANSDYISWERLSANKLRGTFAYEQLSVSGVFEFDNRGLPSKFEAMRFNDQTGKKEKWVVEINAYQDFDGLLLPKRAVVSWHLATGEFTWYKVKIEQVKIMTNDDT